MKRSSARCTVFYGTNTPKHNRSFKIQYFDFRYFNLPSFSTSAFLNQISVDQSLKRVLKDLELPVISKKIYTDVVLLATLLC